MNYISVNLYRKVINHALSEGMTKDDFINLPTPISDMDSIQAVPADDFFTLHEMIDEKLGPGFSVRVGQQMKIKDYGVLGLSWRTCSRAGEIFERSERYFKLLSNTYFFKVEKKSNVSVVYLLREPYRKGLQLSNEATLSATVVVLKAMTEKDILPVEVSFKHEPPSDISSYQKAFQCNILFNQPHYSITYKTVDLEMHTAKADLNINNFLIARVEEEIMGLKIAGNKLVYDIEILIKDALPSGIPSIHKIAEHIGLSNRTLTRRLSKAGVTYRDLLKKVQEEVAKNLLKNSSRSIAEIAFETGFSEQSAFNRAFRRWTGLTPFKYRNSR